VAVLGERHWFTDRLARRQRGGGMLLVAGSESVEGIIVASGVSGTRTVISSVAVAKGCSGAWAGMPRLSTDPANVSRADLVYPESTMQLVSTTVGASFTVNPHSCLFRATTQENAHIAGGTGLFADAAGAFTGSVGPQGLLPRNPDGSCAVGQPGLHEVDKIAFSGTLSF
jgi:hypothetical protein